MQNLMREQCLRTIADGEVPESVRLANERVAVVFTQSWCGDWKFMRRYLQRLSVQALSVFFVEYDREPFFDEMKSFKENVFKNAKLPYVRYYRNGNFVGDSNLIFLRRRFLKKFDVKAFS